MIRGGRRFARRTLCTSQDPITPDIFKTTRWRDAPVSRPEDAMMGVMFVTQARPPFVVEDASHWVFTGTGLRNGDELRNSDGTSFLDRYRHRHAASVRRIGVFVRHAR